MADSGKAAGGRPRRTTATRATTTRAATTPARKTRAAAATATKVPRGAHATATTAPAPTAVATPPSGYHTPETYVVRSGEDAWTEEELREVHAGLTEDVARLRAEIALTETEIADMLRDGGESAGDDQADTGTKNVEREHGMSLANHARGMLLQSERALRRLADGTYGVCESCGSPVGKARSQAFPRATLCVSCKQREERR